MKKVFNLRLISPLLAVFLLLFTIDCFFKKPEIDSQIVLQEKIEKLEQELKQLKKEEDSQIKELIYLINARQNELSKKSIYPFIPKEVIFCGEKVPLNRFDVRERLEWALMYESNRWATALIFLRSGRWFPMIEEKIKENNLPEDLKYIAAIESDLNPEASSSAGAKGLWQFIKDTARDLCNLRVDSYVDERLDYEKSTEAALEHLKELYQDPEISEWMSALVCYNMHRDRYVDEKKKERARDFYNVKDIPLQARRYPFLAIAVKLIMENPEKYGFPSLEEINKIKYKPYPAEAKIITVNYQTERIVEIAERLGMTYYEFRVLNPHILIKIKKVRGVYKVVRDYLPKGQYKIYVKIKRTP